MNRFTSLTGKRILVTGANGFIGAHLVKKLVDVKTIVYALASPQSKLQRLRQFESKFNIVQCDLLDPVSLSVTCAEICPQIVFHLASYGVYSDQTDLLRVSQVNGFGLTNLLVALGDHFECFIYTGTAIEYGAKKAPMKETDLLEPNNFYGATKAGNTLLLQAYAVHHKKKIITLRPFYIYGPGEAETRLIRTIIRACLEGRELPLTSFNETRDFVFVEDLIRAYLIAASDYIQGSHIINIGTGVETSFREVIEIIEGLTQRKIKVVEGKYEKRPWSSHCWAADAAKAKQLLNWSPTYTLREGISEVLKWHCAEKAGAGLS